MKRKITIVGDVIFTHIYGPAGDLLDIARSDFHPRSLGQKARTRSASPKLKKLMSLMAAQDDRCFYCNEVMSMLDVAPPKMPTIDEVVPQSKGGRRNRSNQVAACYGCNARKANRAPTEDELQRLSTLLDTRPATLVGSAVAEALDDIEQMEE